MPGSAALPEVSQTLLYLCHEAIVLVACKCLLDLGMLLHLDLHILQHFMQRKAAFKRKLKKDAKLPSVTHWCIPVFSET